MLNTAYTEQVENASKFLKNWHPALIATVLDNLDKEIPSEWHPLCIPNNRKSLIIKIVTLRYNKLNNLISARI